VEGVESVYIGVDGHAIKSAVVSARVFGSCQTDAKRMSGESVTKGVYIKAGNAMRFTLPPKGRHGLTHQFHCEKELVR
jgi:hypothetical protein